MLYLNKNRACSRVGACTNLTLTSVVFEFYIDDEGKSGYSNLTLTSVVFEL